MPIIVRDPISAELTTDDIHNAFAYKMEKLKKEYKCPNCGATVYMAVVVSNIDYDLFQAELKVLDKFYENHPKILQTMLKDLMDDILDSLGD